MRTRPPTVPRPAGSGSRHRILRATKHRALKMRVAALAATALIVALVVPFGA